MSPSLFGFLCCNKPADMTSRDLVNMVRGNVRRRGGDKTARIGHAGTLDPLATGVLVVGVGIANRLTQYVQEQPKRYRTTMLFGASSVSGDLEETVIEHPELPLPSLEQVHAVAQQMTGTISQRPPAHSAVWVDGKRAYEWARQGTTIEMPQRDVDIHSIEILSFSGRELVFDVECGSGTYIRSLVMDFAEHVGNRGVMTRLERTRIGNFDIEDAVNIDQIRGEDLRPYLRPLAEATVLLPTLQVDDHDVMRLRNGLFVASTVPALTGDATVSPEGEAAFYDSAQNLRGIVRKVGLNWRPYRVFHEPAS